MWTLSSGSKFPSSTMRGGVIPYAWDPSADDEDDADEDDSLHALESVDKPISLFNPRSISNLGVLIFLVVFLLCLFIALPVILYVKSSSHTLFLEETSSSTINTPQGDLHVSSLIDPDTPHSAKTRVGFDGKTYDLVFSDEFNLDDRTFYPGDDPYWEAADLWYLQTGDQEWYDPRQVYTANGSLHVRIENVPSNGMSYRSGMLQSWNKFCFTSGYIEVALTLPGPNEETRGYVGPWPYFLFCPSYPLPSGLGSGRWAISPDQDMAQRQTACGLTREYFSTLRLNSLMLKRFFRYDSCDVGTFPNQTNPDGLGPAAALHSNASQAKYNYELSYLSGQKISCAISAFPVVFYLTSFLYSACTCPGEDHPGPSNNKGRGAPEIDVLEAEHNKQGTGGVISQSAQFAPFSHDYVFANDTTDKWEVFNAGISRPNNYRYALFLTMTIYC